MRRIRQLARMHTEAAINEVATIMRSGARESDRLAAAKFLIEYGWGRPTPMADSEWTRYVNTLLPEHRANLTRDEVLRSVRERRELIAELEAELELMSDADMVALVQSQAAGGVH